MSGYLVSSITSLVSELRADVRAGKLLPALSAGVILGLIHIVYEILFGALVFSGPLAPFLSRGIGIMVFGAFAVCLVVALTGGYRGVIANHPTVVVIALATIAAAIPLEGNALFMTLAAIVIVGSVATGACFLAIGHFRLADLLRFVPYPVACGVLAGVGGLITLAALSMMKATPGWHALPSLLETTVLWNWGPGVVYGLGLFLSTQRWRSPWILPASFLLGAVLYHMSLPLLDISGEEAEAAGLLFANVMEGTLWPPFQPGDLAYVDWGAVAGQIPNMLSLVAVILLGAVIYLGSFELATNRELEWNREFKVAGGASVIAGLGGGPAGFINLPFSMLNHRLGAETRLTGVITALVLGSVLVVGDAFVRLVPVPLLAGMAMFIGVGLLDEWLVRSRRRLPRPDYAIVLAIFVAVIFLGFAEGVGIGMAITTVHFAIRLSRVDPIETVFTVRERRSNRTRRIADQAILLAEGDRVHGYRPRGYLFFGSAHALASRLKQSLSRDPPPACILLDFEAVSGLDFSAVNTLCQFVRAAHDAGVRTALCAAPENCRAEMERNLPSPVFTGLLFEADADRGLEQCEDIVIAARRADLRREDGSGDALLDRFAGDIESHLDRRILFEDMAHELRKWLEVRDYDPGQTLVALGEPQDGLQLLLMGRASVYDAGGTRLRQCGPGDAIGIRAAFEAHASTTAAVADEPCRTLTLTPAVRQRLEKDQERLMLELYGYLLTAGADAAGLPESDAR